MVMENKINWLQQGWECPKCGAVMSPTTACCVNCRGNKGGGIPTTITNPAEIDTQYTGYPPINDPSSICSTSSNESVVYGEEDPRVKFSKYWAKNVAVGVPNSVFDAAGGPPELGFDNSGYKEDPEEQWERYQLNV
jgi:hypothetical protein